MFAGEAKEGFEEGLGLELGVEGVYSECAEEKEDVLGGRCKNKLLAMRGAVCFQVAEIRPA